MVVDDAGTEFGFMIGGGVLAEGLGPEAVGVGFVGVGKETEVAGGGDGLLDSAEIGAEFRIGIDAKGAVF